MKRFLFILLSIVAMSCSGGRESSPFGGRIEYVEPESESKLQGTPVLLDKEILDVFWVAFVADSLMVLEFPQRSKLFSAYNVNTGECINDFIYVGRGPKELLSASYYDQYLEQNDTTELFLYDLMSQEKFYAFNLTEAISSGDIHFRPLGKVLPNTLACLNIDNSTNLLWRLTDNKITYQKVTTSGEILNTWVIFPDITADCFSFMSICSALSPKKDKVVTTMSSFPLFCIFNFDTGERRTFTSAGNVEFENALAEYKSVNTFPDGGYINVKTTGEYICALLEYSPGVDFEAPVSLQIIDWKGNIKRQLLIEEKLTTFTIDDDDMLMYGRAEDGVIYRYDLSEYVE